MDRNLAAAAVIAALAAIAIASYYPLVGDEQFHAYAAMWSAKSGVLASNNLEFFKGWTYIYPPLFPILALFSSKAFGGALGILGAARLVSIIAFVLLVALTGLFGKLGRAVGAVVVNHYHFVNARLRTEVGHRLGNALLLVVGGEHDGNFLFLVHLGLSSRWISCAPKPACASLTIHSIDFSGP